MADVPPEINRQCVRNTEYCSWRYVDSDLPVWADALIQGAFICDNMWFDSGTDEFNHVLLIWILQFFDELTFLD